MKTLLLKILLISLIATNSFADNDVVSLLKGQPAPFDGLLFTIPKAEDLKRSVVERDNYKLLSESLERSIDLFKKNDELNNQKVNILLEQNDKLAKNLYEARSTSTAERVLWFGLGLAVTGMAIYGAKTLTK